jgi:hypothetical protein
LSSDRPEEVTAFSLTPTHHIYMDMDKIQSEIAEYDGKINAEHVFKNRQFVNLTSDPASVNKVSNAGSSFGSSYNSNYKSNEQNDWEVCLNLLESGYKPSKSPF